MEHVATRAGKVAIEVRGEGPPLVLLHSVAHDRHDYDAVVPELSRTHRTIAVDWPGHGASEMWAEPRRASASLLCDALEDVASALDLRRAVVMGSSIGGAAAMHLALRAPARVGGLVLVDTSGFTGTSALVRIACWLQGRELVRRLTGMAFARSYLKVPGAGVDAVLARLAEARKRPGFIEMDAALWRSFGTGATDLTGRGRELDVPALVVWGKHDPVIRKDVEGRRTRDELPNARWIELDSGHVPFVERPREFLAAVSPFLAGLQPARAEAHAP